MTASPDKGKPKEKEAFDQFRFLDREIPSYLLNPAIIPKPGKVAGMIWIVKHFQTHLMSA